MTTAPSAAPGRSCTSRRMAALLIGVSAEVVLLGALAMASWGSWLNEGRDPLSFDDGLPGLVVFGGAGTVFVIAAALAIAAPRRSTDVVATMLLFVAAFIGFVGFALTSLSRQELSDC